MSNKKAPVATKPHETLSNNTTIETPDQLQAFTIACFDAGKTRLNKQFEIQYGVLAKTTGAHMSSGSYSTHSFSTPAELYKFFKTLKPSQAVGIGVCRHGDKGKVTTRRASANGTVSRTKDNFEFSNCFVFDIDGSTLSIEDVRPALIDVDQSLEQASMLIVPSSSYGVHIKGKEAKSPTTSYHVWIGNVQGDIEAYGKAFAKKCWLTDLGSIVISASGSLLVRQLIDASVFSPERLVFEAAPTLGKGVVQLERPRLMFDGGLFIAELNLTEQEETNYRHLVRTAQQDAKAEASKVKEDYITRRVEELVSKGVDEFLAIIEVTTSLTSGELYGHQRLHFKEHGWVTVADVLEEPSWFDGCCLADPLEPDYNNSLTVAKFFADNNVIHSFAHGGKSYRLKVDVPEIPTRESLQARVSSAIEDDELDTSNMAQWITEQELDEVSQEFLIEAVMTQLSTGRIKGELKKAVKRIQSEQRNQDARRFRENEISVQADLSRPLNPAVFPNRGEDGQILPTKQNLIALLKGYGIGLNYDVIVKEQLLEVSREFCPDLAANAKLAEIDSLCGLNCVPVRCLNYLSPLFAENPSNPVVDYLSKLEWDGVDHITALATAVKVAPESAALWPIALMRWLIQCVAAADSAEQTPNKEAQSKFEHCLVLVGAQGVRKTSFFNSLMPKSLKAYFADGLHLNPSDKDSVKLAITNWIVELGEIDATFSRSDNARLKAFLSKRTDALRLPYDRAESKFARRTSFCGSVNDTKFLTDATGSRRFWPVEVLSLPKSINNIDQLWAQAWSLYLEGEIWWVDEEMQPLVTASGKQHATDNMVLDALETKFHLERSAIEKGKFYTAYELADMLEIPRSRGTSKEIRQTLESKGIERKKLKGRNGFYLYPRCTFGLD